jgi:transposase
MRRKIRNTQGELIAMKKKILDKCIKKEMKCKEGAKLFKMHPKAFSRLKRRYIEEGKEALIPKKPVPKKFTPVNRTPKKVSDIVVIVAEDNMDLGPVPLADRLEEKFKIKIHPTTVWRILKREKVRYTTTYRRWKETAKQYCLDEPGEEVQLDGCYPFGRSRKVVSFDVIDDCSKWTYGKIYDRENCENAIDFVNNLVRKIPFRIQKIRVDNRYGHKLREHCERLGIEVIENDPYTPEQNGKVERFHRTLKRKFFWKYCSFNDSKEVLEYKYSQWQNYYNYKRRHGGYKMERMTPREKIAKTMLLNISNQKPEKVTLTLQQYKN